MSDITFNRNTAKSAKGFPDLDAAVKVIADGNREHSRIYGQVMFDAALLTYHVFEVVGAVGKDGKWTSQKDYAKDLGFSEAYGTQLRRMARAAVVHKINPGDVEWTLVTSKGGGARVGTLVKAEPDEEITDPVTGVQGKASRLLTLAAKELAAGAWRATPGSLPRNVDKDANGDSGEGKAPEVVVAEMPLADLLNALDKIAKGADRETWATLENRLNSIVVREVTVRAKADKRDAAAKAKAEQPAA